MNAAGMEVRNIFWLLTGTPWSSSCMSWTSCSSLSKTAGRCEMPLLVEVAAATEVVEYDEDEPRARDDEAPGALNCEEEDDDVGCAKGAGGGW